MDIKKKTVSMSFDEMFGNAQEYIPDPDDLNEDEFATLDEEDAGGEEDLEDMELEGLEPSDEPEESEDEEDDFNYGFADDEEDEELEEGETEDDASVDEE